MLIVATDIILPKYVFRGTCLGFAGSNSSRNVPYTCTIKNPIKAVLFAMHCQLHYYHAPVIYVAKTENLKHLTLLKANKRMDSLEEAINFRIAPISFYPFCEGYLMLSEMKNILKMQNIPITASVKLDNLTEKCEQSVVLGVEDIDKIFAESIKILKK